MTKYTPTKFTGVRTYASEIKRHRGRPDICYTIRWTRKGTTHEEAVGWSSEGITAAYAANVRAKRMSEDRHGLPSGPPPTMAACWEEYMARHLADRPSRASDENRWTKHVAPRFGKDLAPTITPKRLEAFRDDLAKDYAPQTVKHILTLIRRVLNKCTAWGMLDGPNPVSKTTLPKVNNARFRFLTKEEAEILLQDLNKRSVRTYRMATIGLYTGMRFGEVAALRWGQVDLIHGAVNVTDAKTGNTSLPMNSKVKDVFLAMPPGGPEDLVFPSRTGGISPEPSDAFTRSVQALGLNKGVKDPRQKVVYHTLRHTFASWLVIKGVPLYTVARLLGHSDTRTTQRYAHLAPTQTMAVAKLLED